MNHARTDYNYKATLKETSYFSTGAAAAVFNFLATNCTQISVCIITLKNMNYVFLYAHWMGSTQVSISVYFRVFSLPSSYQKADVL